MKMIGFMPTAGKEESTNACRTAKDEGKSYEDTSKIDGKYGARPRLYLGAAIIQSGIWQVAPKA